MKKRVLILCTGNSCRSQMAEVLWREMGGEHWQVYSAGSQPAGYVHRLALEVLDELGLDTTGLNSKSLDQFCVSQIDLVVTVCDHAKESCRILPDAAEQLHWPFEDPADFHGDDHAKRLKFREIRDQIKDRIQDYLQATNTLAKARES